MSTKQQRKELVNQIKKVIALVLRVERTYTDLTRTNDQNEELREELTWQLGDEESKMLNMINEL